MNDATQIAAVKATVTIGSDICEDRTPAHGYEPTCEAAMAAFAKRWRE